MRYLIFFLSVLLISCNNSDTVFSVKIIPSKIDSLNTESHVERYVQSLDSNYRRFKLQALTKLKNRHDSQLYNRTRIIAETFNLNKSFYKADLDNNGYTDLLAIGDNEWCDTNEETCSFAAYIIMNFGADSVNVCDMVRQDDYPIVPQITSKENKPSLILHDAGKIDWVTKKIVNNISIKMTYNFDNYIEFNETPTDSRIEKIEYATFACFGKCPIFQISIDENQNAVFFADYYNFGDGSRESYKQDNLFFSTIIDNQTYNNLSSLLNYIDFKNLKDGYNVPWTDAQSSLLKITYSNGKVKTIQDYGLSGTYGLKAVYDKMFKLRFNQKWKKINKPKTARLNPY